MPDELRNEFEIALLARNREAFLVAQSAKRYLYERGLPLARARARKLGLDFNLTRGFLISLMRSQDYVCAVSGLPFDMHRTGALGRTDRLPFRPSIDRINADSGYTEGNVRIVCLAVNVGLSDWGDDVHREISAAVSRADPAADLMDTHTKAPPPLSE